MNLPDEVIERAESAASDAWHLEAMSRAGGPLSADEIVRLVVREAAPVIVSYAYEQGSEDARAEIRAGIDALYGTEDVNEVGDGYDNGILAALASLDSTGKERSDG